MSEAAAVREIPRKGRIWVILALAIAIGGLGYLVVAIATLKPGDPTVEVTGINDAQRLFGGVPQEGDRLGSSDAPVTIQVFNDLQCANCREDFLDTIPTLAEDYARPGDAQLLYRHYSNSENVEQLGFFGAEAAAEQNYGWQYTYLFFHNQEEAGHFGVDQEFLDAIAAGIEELDYPKWKDDLERDGGPKGPLARRLAGYEELGSGLGIRIRQAAIVTGPNGTRTLQDGPKLARIEQAIREVQ
ncbi:MAG TPA: thioredoxin domain-containing protein [Solirubrobacterales bacterium]|nr:thioredoxin domain-containing protein [Solirubrobacterales bacterium]